MKTTVEKKIAAIAAGALAIVVALVTAAAMAVWNDPGVRTIASTKLGCPAVNQLVTRFAEQAGTPFDDVKCISIAATDPTHWTAVVAVRIGEATRQWDITFSTNGIDITSATPVASS